MSGISTNLICNFYIFMEKNFVFNTKLNNLINWKIDKIVIESGEVRKLEFYNYIKRSDVGKLIKFLNTKSFKFCDNTKEFNKIFNVILGQNRKHINWRGEIYEDIEERRYYYYVDFVKVVNNRWSNFLLKIYRNKSKNKDFSKIEITYWRKKNGYNLYYGDWINKMKGISELINKISKKFEMVWYDEDFSWWIDIKSKIFEIINWYDQKKKEKVTRLLT